MAGIIVDALRMHVTKGSWDEFLALLSKEAGRPISEFHASDFHGGNGIWRPIEGPRRAAIITSILDWLKRRRHVLTFVAVEKSKFDAVMAAGSAEAVMLRECGTPWRLAALHSALTIQKAHQRYSKNKGHSVMIFDRKTTEEAELSQLIHQAPGWTDEYYDRGKRQAALDQLVDVPYFIDSRHALLIQVADLLNFILRRFYEMKEGVRAATYKDEESRVNGWIKQILELALPCATRYPKVGRDACAELFFGLAPVSIRDLGR